MVGMADMKAGRNGDIITTLGLGSCIGITLFDAATRIGGMVHIMLPDSTSYQVPDVNLAKFADTGIPALRDALIKMGASPFGIVAKLAGGANMFSQSAGSDVLKVGQRNASESLRVLQKLNIKVLAQDTGGTYGRTISLYTTDGSLLIKTIGHGEKTL